jgi:uncharacterized damage-inducible protein DinB
MTELWLSGPVDGVPPFLMPAAHTFLQVRQDVPKLLAGLSLEQLWKRVGQSAAIGFHALHIAGATDRLMTYARGEQLSDAQLADARSLEQAATGVECSELLSRVQWAMDAALEQIRATPDAALLAPRGVGRKNLPSNTLGLIAHAAEHALRHAGQIATLKKVIATNG